ANVATQLVAFAVMLAIVIVLSLVYVPEGRDVVWLSLPLAMLVVCLVAGVALALAAANAVFRDVEHIIAALLLPWFFLTPVLYSLDRVPGAKTHPWFERLIHWGNFMTPAIESLREPLYFGHAPRAAEVIYVAVAAVVALAVGALVFTRVDARIAVEV